MGNNVKEEVLVDFFGLPGSGKSTIARILSNELVENGFEVQENIYIINNKHSTLKRMFVKVLNTITFTLRHYLFMRDLFSVLGSYPFKNYAEEIKQWINVCFVMTNINKNGKHNYKIADQGIMQAAISLTANCEKDCVVEVVKRLCEKVTPQVKFVYVDVEIETVLRRLDSRTNGKSRIENEKDINAKQHNLESLKTTCDSLARVYNCVKVVNNKNMSKESELSRISKMIFDELSST